MLSFFKRLFSSKSEITNSNTTQKIVPLEIQMEKLKDIGFSLNDGLGVDFLLKQFDRSVYESDPFGCILYVYVSEHEKADGTWKQNSSDILVVDTECTEGNGSYVKILEKFRELSKDVFKISNIKDFIDFDSKTAWVSFDFQGIEYRWDVRLEDDWFDIELIDKINALLITAGSSKRFYTYLPDQNLFIVFLDEMGVKKLNELATYEFK